MQQINNKRNSNTNDYKAVATKQRHKSKPKHKGIRKSKLALIKKTNTKSSKEVKQALIDITSLIKSMIHTITSDNGKEFAQHKEIAKELSIEYYFAQSVPLVGERAKRAYKRVN